jgi:hypothetical protein
MFTDKSISIANLKEFKYDLQCSNELWEATEMEWQTLPQSAPVWFPSALAMLLNGSPIHESLSTFTVLVLLGGILAHIVTHERLTWYQDAEIADEQRTPMFLRTLHAWEETWKRHPQANPNPYNDTHGPLMADAIPLLNTAYFHVYIPRLLQRIKEHLTTTAHNPELTREEFYALLMPHSETERYNLFRATTHAAHSLLIRARLGFNLVARTSSLDMGFHYGYTGFDLGNHPHISC